MKTAGLLIMTYSAILLLHVADTVIWAVFYYIRELFPTFETSLYFSLTSYTTIGFGDVVLPERWRLLGAIEGISGVLLCGLSTAMLFLRQYLRFARTEAEKGACSKSPPPIVPEPTPIARTTAVSPADAAILDTIL
jgi:voltage-gated potassium channel Kch